MNKEIFLHIGMHKTGTSFLQNNVYSSNDNLLYLNNIDNPIADFFNLVKDQDLYSINLEEYKTKINNFVEKNTHKKFLYCSEKLFGNPLLSYVNRQNIFYAIKYMFPSAKIIVTFRQQVSFVKSFYAQVISEGYSGSFNRFIVNKKNRNKQRPLVTSQPYINLYTLNYYSAYKSLLDFFPRKNIQVLFYEDMKLDEAGFILKISNFLNEKLSIQSSNVKVVNRSYSKISIIIANIFNRIIFNEINNLGFIPERPLCDYFKRKRYKMLSKLSCGLCLANILKNYLDRIFYVKMKFDIDEEYVMKKYFKSSNRKLAEELGIDLSIFKYY